MANSENLVFVLGAGASSHFGYPLGNQLIEAMHKFLNTISRRNASQYNLDPDVKKARDFLLNIRSYNPLNIDYYLHNNPEQEEIGKRLIEATILYCQNTNLFRHNTSEHVWWDDENGIEYFHSSNWVKFLHHKIVANCKELEDVKNELESVHIITFNYDLSFEQSIWGYFKNSRFSGIKDYLFNEYFSKNIIHIYGKVVRKDVNNRPIKEDYECDKFDPQGNNAYTLFNSSRGEEINITGVDKSKPHEKAIKIIENANLLYFLGYAFDEFNNYVIGLNDGLKSERNKNIKNLYYTNYSKGTIVDSKVRSFFDGLKFSSFGADSRITQGMPASMSNRTIDIIKSEKDVYEALEKDLFIPVMKKDS